MIKRKGHSDREEGTRGEEEGHSDKEEGTQ